LAPAAGSRAFQVPLQPPAHTERESSPRNLGEGIELRPVGLFRENKKKKEEKYREERKRREKERKRK
jgi:hypothetical protein